LREEVASENYFLPFAFLAGFLATFLAAFFVAILFLILV
jgi:hypothetical protein